MSELLLEEFEPVVERDRVDRIRGRVREFDWAAMPDLTGWQGGIDRDLVSRLCAHWCDRWDPDAWVARLRRRRQVAGRAGDLPVHLIHERRRPGADGLPIVLLHGWPGTVFEFERVLDPLLTAGHEVIVLSLPGYGFASPLPRPVSPREVAHLVHRVVTDGLGHPAYVVHGTDWGSRVAGWLGIDHADACAGVHLSMLTSRAEDARVETAEEQAWRERFRAGLDRAGGYQAIQRTRPQTLGFALADSPVGAAAWIWEKYAEWAGLARPPGARWPSVDDVLETFGADLLVDIAMLYLTTSTLVTSTWMYLAAGRDPASYPGSGLRVPVGAAAFPDPLALVPPRSLVERSFAVVQWDEPRRGGHFPALEAPDELVGLAAPLRRASRGPRPRLTAAQRVWLIGSSPSSALSASSSRPPVAWWWLSGTHSAATAARQSAAARTTRPATYPDSTG
ncbi:alpha/beta fold hydrolase [Nocardioides humi]|uniref:alpha/beta fold hydrolase n=1 Tax=Nocardioides humi TaxID=449461 RepID=UPI00112A67D7